MSRSFTFKLYQVFGTFPYWFQDTRSNKIYLYTILVLVPLTLLYLCDVFLNYLPSSFKSEAWAPMTCETVEALALILIVPSHLFSLFRKRSEFVLLWTTLTPEKPHRYELILLLLCLTACTAETLIYASLDWYGILQWTDLQAYNIMLVISNLIQAQYVSAVEEICRLVESSGSTDVCGNSDLFRLAEILNDFYGWQTLFYILLQTVSTARIAFDIADSVHKEEGNVTLIVTSCNLLVRFFQLIVVVLVTERSKHQVGVLDETDFC